MSGIAGIVAAIAIFGDDIQAILGQVDDFLQNVFAKDWTEVFGPVLGDAINGFFANIKNTSNSIGCQSKSLHRIRQK